MSQRDRRGAGTETSRGHFQSDSDVPHLVQKRAEPKRLPAVFYRTGTGREPVREWLKTEIDADARKAIGVAIKKVELLWPLGRPTCSPMGRGLWEVRVSLDSRIARVLFCVHGENMVLLHGFVKKSQKTPKKDLDTAIDRKREVEKKMSRVKSERNPHIGSSFDEFLEEEGIQAEVTTGACREAIAHLVADCMERHSLTKTEMAARMNTSRQALDRLLNPAGGGLTIDTLERAAAAVGKTVKIEFKDRDGAH